MKNLRVLLTIAIAGTALLMSVLIGGLVMSKTMKTTSAQARTLLIETTEKNASVIENRIQKAELLTDQLIVDGITGFSLKEFKGKPALLTAHMEKINPLIQESVRVSGAKSGWFLMDPRIIGGTVFVSFYQDKQGGIQESPPYDIYTTGVYRDPWYSVTLDKGTQWTPPLYWDRWNAHVISYCKRIEKDGQVLGVAGTDLYMDDLVSELSKIKIHKSGYVVLMDQNLNVLYHPDPKIKNLKAASDEKTQQWADKIASSTENFGIIDYSVKYRHEIIAYKRLSNGWILASVPSVNEFYAEQRSLASSIILATEIGVLLSIGIALLLGHITSKPFIRLNHELRESNQNLILKNNEIDAQRLELDFHANNDALTGIPNRRAGLHYLDHLIELSHQSHVSLCVVFIDIDNLKHTNDTYGHNCGDQLLAFVSKVITDNLRTADLVCRLGGDEFLVVLPGCDLNHSKELVEVIRHHMDIEKQQLGFDVSFSYGISEFPVGTDAPVTVDEMIRRADEKMYERKTARKCSQDSCVAT